MNDVKAHQEVLGGFTMHFTALGRMRFSTLNVAAHVCRREDGGFCLGGISAPGQLRGSPGAGILLRLRSTWTTTEERSERESSCQVANGA